MWIIKLSAKCTCFLPRFLYFSFFLLGDGKNTRLTIGRCITRTHQTILGMLVIAKNKLHYYFCLFNKSLHGGVNSQMTHSYGSLCLVCDLYLPCTESYCKNFLLYKVLNDPQYAYDISNTALYKVSNSFWLATN